MRRLALTAIAVLAAGLFQPCLAAQGPSQPHDRVLVMPFENVKRDPSIFWLGEASAVLVGDGLLAQGGAPITRPERQQAFERLQVPTAAVLTDATVIRLGQLVGASEVIVGSLQLEGDALVVQARSIALEAGRVRTTATERGPLANLLAIFDRLARALAPASASGSPRAVDGDRPPVAAFENYIKGLLAETPATALGYLNAALALHPTYDRARLALWDVYVEQGDDRKALTAVEAVPSTSTFSRRARFLAGLSHLNLRAYDEAYAVFHALADQEGTPTILNNLGIVQLRRGATPRSGTAAYYFHAAAEADPDDPDYVFNLGYAYWEEHDTQASIYWLRETVRRSPADGAAHFILGAALAAADHATESAREKDLARRLSSLYEQWDKRPAGEQVPKGLERVKNEVELPHARRIETRIASAGQREQQELATFYLERARRLFERESDRDATAELDRALYLSPYLAEAHLLLGRIHLRNGRVHEAIDALKIALWSAETAEEHAVLGMAYQQAKDFVSARAEAQRALVLDPGSAEAKTLLDMLKSP